MTTPNELTPLTGTLETVTGDGAQRLAKQLRGSANQALRSAKNAIAEASANTAQTLKSAAISADDYVHENPWIAIGVTAGIAAVVGYFAGRLGPSRR